MRFTIDYSEMFFLSDFNEKPYFVGRREKELAKEEKENSGIGKEDV